MTLNAHVTNIRTRNPVVLRLLEWAVKLAGGTLRYWKSHPAGIGEGDE